MEAHGGGKLSIYVPHIRVCVCVCVCVCGWNIWGSRIGDGHWE